MEYEVKRDLNHSYLILTGRPGEPDGYPMRMLEKNRLEGMLPCSVRHVDGQPRYYFDISSRQPLEAAFSIRKMDGRLLQRIFLQLEADFQELEQYLLDSAGLILDIRYMYWDMERERLCLVYCPQVWRTEEKDIAALAEDLLGLIDHGDPQAVDGAYFFYRQASMEGFTFSGLFSYFHKQLAQPDASGQESGEAALEASALPRRDEAEGCGAAAGAAYRETRAAGAEQTEPSGAARFFQRGAAGVQKEDPDAESAAAGGAGSGRLDWKRFLLVLAAGLVLLALVAKYGMANYVLSERELLIGGGILAALPAAYLIYGLRKRKAEKLLEEKAEGEVEAETTPPAAGEAARPAGEAESGCLPVLDSGREAEEDEAQERYGETVYLGADAWQQERCLEGRVKGKPVSITIHATPFVIGKQPGAVSYVLPDATVSRMHAQFTEKGGKLFLQDMHSKNGTFKNGVAMEADQAVEVFPGDEIRFGRLRFTYH